MKILADCYSNFDPRGKIFFQSIFWSLSRVYTGRGPRAYLSIYLLLVSRSGRQCSCCIHCNREHGAGTERRCRVANTSALYSECPGFKNSAPALLLEDFRGFPQSLQANIGIVP
jgi:hypothetical protein